MFGKAVVRLAALGAALFLFLPASQVLARDIWVDVNGSDSGSGFDDSPWRTLQRAVDSAAPGDVIWVREGTYAGFRAERSGEEDAWITLKAAPDAQVIIDRPGEASRHQSNMEFETWEGDGVVAYWRMEGFTILDAPRYGIDIRGSEDSVSHHFVISGNQVQGSGKTGIFAAFTDDVAALGNESHRNGEHGIYISNSGDRHQVLNNRIHDNYGCGLHMNGDVSMGGDGVIDGVLIQENDLWSNGRGGGAAINLDGVINSLVYDNIIQDNLAGGIALFQGDGAVASHDSEIRGNLIRMPDDSRWAVNLTDVGCVNVILDQNHIESANGSTGSIRLPLAGLAGFVSDYNELTNRFSVDGGDSVIDLGRWRALGYDLHSSLIP